MELRKFIATTIREYLNEQQMLRENLDLSTFDNAKKWVISQQIDDVVNEDGDDLDYDYRAVNGMDVEELIYEYVSKYNNVKNEDFIEIYRLIRLDNINQLELDNIGEYWSFEETGVGDYGSGRREFKGNKKFVLTGLVEPSNIDWEHGFYSFLFYPDQDECALKAGTNVKITEINGQELKKELVGVVK
jgi:hypothetical protein